MKFEQNEAKNKVQMSKETHSKNSLFKVSSLDSLDNQNFLEISSTDSLNLYDQEEPRNIIGMIKVNLDYNIIFLNDTTCEMFGYQPDELLGQPLELLLSEQDRKAHNEDVSKFIPGSNKFEGMSKHRIIKGQHKNGTIFPISVSISKMYHNGKLILNVALRPPPNLKMQLDPKKNIVTIEMFFQASQLLNNSHENIIDLFNTICFAAVNQFGLDMAWLGMLEDGKTAGIKPVSYAGNEAGYLNAFSSRNEHFEVAPIKTTLTNGTPTIIYDISLNSNESKWRIEAISRGYQSLAVFALFSGNKIIGVLNLFGNYEIFIDKHLKILQSFVNQAAYAIEINLKLRRVDSSIKQLHESILEGWVKTLDLRDTETEHHTQRVTELTLKLAKRIGISKQELINIKWGALLHDIGKIGIPDKILYKPGKFTLDERIIMERHPQFAYDLISKFPFLSSAIDIPYCHHEKWNGNGYPRGLKMEKIPLSARIFSVVDVFDALTSDRPYRKAWDFEKTVEYIKKQSGIYFDPEIVIVFIDMIKF